MSRRPAKVTQADIARALRAVAQLAMPMAVEIAPDGTIRLVPIQMEKLKTDASVAAPVAGRRGIRDLVEGMPKPRPPHLHYEITRHGKGVWNVRVNKGKRTRIREPYGTEEFWTAYHDALAGKKPGKSIAKAGTLAWLVSEYYKSSEWAGSALRTQNLRRAVLKHMLGKAGDKPCTAITKTKIIAARDLQKATPGAANTFLKTVRALFKWALEAEHIKINPTDGVKGLSQKSEGFAPWTDEDIARFEARWPLGTRERLAFAVLFYTGLRRGDAAKFGRPHVKSSVARLKTEKTGETVYISVEPELAAAIAAGALRRFDVCMRGKRTPANQRIIRHVV